MSPVKRIALFITGLIAVFTYGQVEVDDDLARLEQRIDSGETLLRSRHRPAAALAIAFDCLGDSSLLVKSPHHHKAALVLLVGSLDRLYRQDLAIPYLHRILEVEEKAEGTGTVLYEMTLGSLGAYHLEDGEDSLAYLAFRNAIHYSRNINKPIYHASAINNLGWFWEHQGNPDSAMFYYNLARERTNLTERRDSLLWVSILENQSSIYRKQGEVEKSREILRSNLEFLGTMARTAVPQTLTLFALIRRNIELNDLAGTADLLRTAENHLEGSDMSSTNDLRIELEEIWIEYLNHTGQEKELQPHYKRLTGLMEYKMDETRENSAAVSRLFAEYASREYEQELERKSALLASARRETRSQRALVWAIGIFSVFGVVLLYLFNQKRIASERLENKMMEQALENERLKGEKAMMNLKYLESDVGNMMSQVSLKKNWTSEVAESLSEALSIPDQQKPEALRKLIQEFRQKGAVYEKFDIQQSGLREVNARFFAELRERYPDLTKQEQELCGFIRLNLDTKEIATLRNIHPASVKKMRHRIRKKMGLAPEADMYEVISGV